LFTAHVWLSLAAWSPWTSHASWPSWTSLAPWTSAAPRALVFMDLGSSGSRLHLITSDAATGKIAFATNELKREIKPGVDTIIADPDSAQRHRNLLVDTAKELCRINGISDVSQVEFAALATAGARQKGSNMSEIMSKLVDYSREAGFKTDPAVVKVSAGNEEAYLSWLATNVYRETLDAAATSRDDIATLDVGGSSLQFSEIPKDNQIFEDAASVNFKHQEYRIYSHSWRQAGMDDARERFSAYMKAQKVTENPCAFKSFNPAGDLKDSKDFRFGDWQWTSATGDAEECSRQMRKFFESERSASCLQRDNRSSCSELDNSYVPSFKGKTIQTNATFYQAFGNMAEIAPIANWPGKKDGDFTGEPDAIWSSIEKGCATDINANPKQNKNPFIARACFDSVYLYSLLEAFGLGQSTKILIGHRSDDVSWSYGWALQHFSN
jgi:hypothetical protein